MSTYEKVKANLALTSSHLSKHDTEFLARLVARMYDEGFVGGTYTDNECEVFERFTSPEELATHLAASEEASLYIYPKETDESEKLCDGDYVGYLFLVFGNGPGELLSDYSITEVAEELASYMEELYVSES